MDKYYYKVGDQLVILDNEAGEAYVKNNKAIALGGYHTIEDFLEFRADVFHAQDDQGLKFHSVWPTIKERYPGLSKIKAMRIMKYNQASKSALLQKEIDLIQSPELKQMVIGFLDNKVPDYFWDIPSSSSGKHHPEFALGYGGLIRHTQTAVAIAKELLKLEMYDMCVEDVVYAAIILHDTFKNGYQDNEHTVTAHPSIAADEFYQYANKNVDCTSQYMKNTIDKIVSAIAGHMGQWGTRDFDAMESTVVHLADYIASRQFFDMWSNA